MCIKLTIDPDRMFDGAAYIKAQSTPSEFSLYDPIPFFRREFEIGEEINSAEIAVQSPGFAVYFINGQPITDDIFISATSDYASILWYDVYDVTRLLKKGKNVIAVMAGNGFFNESFRTAWDFDKAYWRDAPQFLLSLKINGKTAVVSDGQWKASREHSHIIYSHLRSGEFVDMRKFDESWKMAGYDDSDWTPVIERGEDEVTGTLRRCTCQPVREVEVIEPAEIRRNARGYLVDFGTTISGYVGITLTAPRGSEIEFKYTEDVYPDGSVKMNNIDSPHCYPDLTPFHLNKMIASGGVDTFKPHFCYHGFRYVQITGLDELPPSENIKAYFTHNDVPRLSDFKCGNEIIQYIYDGGIRSTYSNMFWCLTDCPTREKLGWMNDAMASVEQTLINFDILPLYKKWFEDIKADMAEDGRIHSVIPTHTWGDDWGPVCDCMLYELPYRVYLYTGDSSMLVGAIDHFERYIGFLERSIAEDKKFILGDWLGNGSSKCVPREFIRDIYLFKALRITDLAYKLSGQNSAVITEKLNECRRSFMERYLDADGRCTVHAQTSAAMMIMNGLYDDIAPLARQLTETVEREDMRLTAGMVGVQYLYDALGFIGRADLAYRMITESEPGYKTWFEYGADTLWERWDGVDRESHNHHMYSNVIGWFFKSLLGIEPDPSHPAFERVELHPHFLKEAGYVYGRMKTVRGEIELGWEYKNGGFEYSVTIPEGIDARFDGRELSVGINKFIIKK